jgi:hypothetical protein
VLSVRADGTAIVLHGGAVECRDEWIFEGVWDGEFESGNFDQSELVFGSGVRVRGDSIICVGSSSTLDRLWVLEFGGAWWVANTLPGALAASGATIDMSYPRYREDIHSAVLGLRQYKRVLPLSGGEVEIVYFDNLRFDAGGGPSRIEKPRAITEWATYEEYRLFLSYAAARIRANAGAPTRRVPYEAIATISSGYDSPAAAVVAREAGAARAFTIRRARALIPRTDSGEKIATALGLTCASYEPDVATMAGEEWFLAALGWSMDLNLAAFDYPSDRVTLLFTGFHGDLFWDSQRGMPSEDFVRGGGPSGLGFTEYRLVAGIINCAVPFWGARHAAAMKRITRSSSMKPWTIGTGYDRPVPRRMAEDAGVGRHLFGWRKAGTCVQSDVFWPVSRSLERTFREFLKARHQPVPAIRLIRLINQMEMAVLNPLRTQTGLKLPNAWIPVQASRLLLPFAVTLIADRLRAALPSDRSVQR